MVASTAKLTFSFAFIFIICDVIFSLLGFGYPSHYEEENIQRHPSPYDMFRGKPNVADHNKYGFRGPDVDEQTPQGRMAIAFFGGSTGYVGTPPIAELLRRNIEKGGFEAIVYNFSSISSNHSQHVHRLLQFSEYPFDLVIFYGGGNESLNYAIYDPRPGYPYNFFVRNELVTWKRFLIQYSSFFGELDKITGWISGHRNLIRKTIVSSDTWADIIVNNYWTDIKRAEKITKRLIAPSSCRESEFLSVLQPANPHKELQKNVWDKITKSENFSERYLNYSNLSSEVEFSDIIHVTQNAKELISSKITNKVLEIIKRNCI